METSSLSNISPKYYKLTNMFSKAKAKVFAPHYLYDLKTNLKESVQPLVGSIYSLLVSE